MFLLFFNHVFLLAIPHKTGNSSRPGNIDARYVHLIVCSLNSLFFLNRPMSQILKRMLYPYDHSM